MATYAVQGPPHAGAQITVQAPGGTAGDLIPTGSGIALLVQNSGTPAVTVTLPIALTYDGQTVTSRQVSCPGVAGAVDGLTLIPVPDSVYGVGTTAVVYSTVAGVNVAAVRVP